MRTLYFILSILSLCVAVAAGQTHSKYAMDAVYFFSAFGGWMLLAHLMTNKNN